MGVAANAAAHEVEVFAKSLAHAMAKGTNELLENGAWSGAKTMSKTMVDNMGQAEAIKIASGKAGSVITHMAGEKGLFGAGSEGAQTAVANMAGRWQIAKHLTNSTSRKAAANELRRGANVAADSRMRNGLLAQAERLEKDPGFFTHVGAYTEAALGSVKDYGRWMIGGNWKQKSTKIGATTAGFVAANGLGRAVFSGGGPFHNGDGERDIAGIPFI